MLFKMSDRDGKFIEYNSVCLPESQFLNAGNYIVNKLQDIRLRNLTYISFNWMSYTLEPFKINFCPPFTDTIFYTLTEIPSEKRKQAFEQKKNIQNSYAWDGYSTSVYNIIGTSASSTSSTCTINVGNTAATYTPRLVYDGYFMQPLIRVI